MLMIIIDPLVGCHYNAICHGTFLGCLANDGVDVFLYPPSLSSQGSQLVSSQFNSWTGNWIENFAHLYSASDLNLEIHSLLLSFAGWSGDPALIELATHWAPLLSIDGVLVYPKETVVCCFVCVRSKRKYKKLWCPQDTLANWRWAAPVRQLMLVSLPHGEI